MVLDVLHQAVRILAHSEEVRFLLRRLHLAAAVRALAVHQLGLSPEAFAGRAVQAFVFTLVDIALLVHLFEHLLDLLLVVLVRGADKAVIGGVHQVPDPLDLRGGLVHILLWGDAGVLRLQLDLLAVLVCAGLEADVEAFFSFEAGDGVSKNDLIGIADVRLSRRVSDRGGDIVRFLCTFLTHDVFPPVVFLPP